MIVLRKRTQEILHILIGVILEVVFPKIIVNQLIDELILVVYLKESGRVVTQ